MPCTVRFSLAVVLTAAGFAAAEEKAVPPELLKGVKDADPALRVKAIMGLSQLGAEAVPALVEALKDPEAEVHGAAAYALRLIKLEPAELLAALRPHLKQEDAAVRQGVAGALVRGGPAALPDLLSLLKDESSGVRKQAVQSLQGVVQKAPAAAGDALPALAKAARDEEAGVRLAVVQALPRFGPDAVPTLLAAVEDEDIKVRAYAAAALTAPALRLDAKTALAPLARRLKAEPEVIVRQSLLRTLGKLGAEAVSVLTEALGDEDASVQKAALTALGQLGPEAKAALPAVRALAAKATHPDLLKTAVAALPRLGPEGAPAVLELLKRDDSAVRLACLQYLASQKDTPPAAVPATTAALADKDERVRALAAYTLGKLGPAAKEALPALEKARSDSDPRVRAVAGKAVQMIEAK